MFSTVTLTPVELCSLPERSRAREISWWVPFVEERVFHGADHGAVAKVVRAARDHGVLVRGLLSSVAVSPPLTVQSEHLALIGESLAHAFDALSRPVAGTR